MGSKKYPGESELDQFTLKSGGFLDAQTDCDDTAFKFETHDEYFDGALDRFSQLFKKPLMRKETMLREREAVNSEFELIRPNDDARHSQLYSSLGQKTHPSSTFLYGNSKTLEENIDDDKLYRKTIEFRKRHYSAHRMYLSLQSSHSLDQLQVRTINRNDSHENGLIILT